MSIVMASQLTRFVVVMIVGPTLAVALAKRQRRLASEAEAARRRLGDDAMSHR